MIVSQTVPRGKQIGQAIGTEYPTSFVNLARFIHPSFFGPDSNSFWRKYAGAGHSRGMAKESGVSVSSVQRIWRAFGLPMHRFPVTLSGARSHVLPRQAAPERGRHSLIWIN
ncbi:hypothetical protein I6F35_38805 [Bradyrhizobium sp. BRP22]|uniref:hypothetical protein n=1 Tax=Bradyrhizobium sp. BRP22 TaxID=2793821 RepID=UPI001CD52EA0|nr:hypothetical protein [Bradyrhizobium sp. BRP22]MCA1458991.1 hypothetical protein [Bradyrhizobium sp. BRP22]